MSTIDLLLNDLFEASDNEREAIYASVEEKYGKGFAAMLRDQFESSKLIADNEASIG